MITQKTKYALKSLMVLGEERGLAQARALNLDALFLLRTADGIRTAATGPLFDRALQSGDR